MTSALAIFVKTPALSPVKTRLAATLGSAEATRFYMLAAAATAAVVRACQPALIPYWAVAETRSQTDTTWQGFAHLWQGEGDLGARMHHVYAELLAQHDRVLLIGADSPQLTPILLKRAVTALEDENAPFVLGDAADGGFWLFGGRLPIPRRVWIGVRYSQADTSAQLRSALAAFGGVATLPELTDVDHGTDLAHLLEALGALSNLLPEQRELAAWLQIALDHLASARSHERQRVDLSG
ncbi:MAG: TIGR04282 family arsenosugar biosynthesis glycosyltransferase [Dokdonella sp.]